MRVRKRRETFEVGNWREKKKAYTHGSLSHGPQKNLSVQFYKIDEYELVNIGSCSNFVNSNCFWVSPMILLIKFLEVFLWWRKSSGQIYGSRQYSSMHDMLKTMSICSFKVGMHWNFEEIFMMKVLV